jgi:hypothetical protein
MFVAALLILIPFLGFALDLTRAYNRKVEMQSVADAAALAAARALDGTSAGVDRAVLAAATAAGTFAYSYSNEVVEWSSAALKFSASADGGWVDAGAASGTARDIFFVKVDTSVLDAKHGRIDNIFMASSAAQTDVAATAVAGRATINITPLAVCAMSDIPMDNRGGELVEFGFRRGVGYDLMRLNPNATTPENFLVNPIAPAGTVGQSVSANFDLVAPFVCTGRMAIPSVTAAAITVERPFPIASLSDQLNSRFGVYAAPCQQSSAPADANVRAFTYTSGANWMKVLPDSQRATELATGGKLRTVADDLAPAGTDAAYGPLWSYAKAPKYSSYLSSGGVEPAAGYATFATSEWGTLYPVAAGAVPGVNSYPSTTPYQSTGGAAAYKTYRNRRVLNIPLLQCPVAAGTKATAQVVAIGKFFMTVRADSTSVYAEFAGVVPETSLGGEVELFK